MTRGSNRATTRPYVDYYAEKKISPVRQDISDERVHCQRRESLYRSLGILPRFVSGADVLEIGPGSGHNALYTASLGPKTYTLVDGNDLALTDCRDLLKNRFPDVLFDFVDGFAEEVATDRRHDLVLAEGMLSVRHNAADLARAIGAQTRPGGVFVITCMDDLSSVGEMTRRIVAYQLAPMTLPFSERVAQLVTAFGPHLYGLAGMSRSHEDWVLDNLTHPFPGPLFPIDSAIEALDDQFDFYGSSPKFVSDWRWYKRLHSGNRDENGRAIRAYRENLLALLDYRATPTPTDPDVGLRAQKLANTIYNIATGADFGERVDIEAAIDTIEQLAALVSQAVPSAALALRECRDILRGRLELADAPAYAAFFGRAQQYVSLTRRDGPRV